MIPDYHLLERKPGGRVAHRAECAIPHPRTGPLHAIRELLIRLLICLVLAGVAETAPVAHAADESCPDLSGQYRVVGSDRPLQDVIRALHVAQIEKKGRSVVFEGVSDGELLVWMNAGNWGTWPRQPSVLRQGQDFECVGQELRFVVAKSSRKTDGETWYEGNSEVSLQLMKGGELAVDVDFKGGQRVTLYSYDSANVSVPKPFSDRRFRDSTRWPTVLDPEPDPGTITETKAEEPRVERTLRQRLADIRTGNIRVGELVPKSDGVLVRITAQNSEDLFRFEDALMDAEIRYRTHSQPVWTSFGYRVELMIRPDGVDSDKANQPSMLRIEKELRRFGPPLAEPQTIKVDGDGYIATLRLTGDRDVDYVVVRLTIYSRLFALVERVDEPESSELPGERIARVRLRVH
jgi:hypothetical protein